MNESRIAVSIEPETVATSRANTASPSSHGLEILKWLFSFPAMLGTGLIGLSFWRARSFVVDPDLWWHIKVGQAILTTGHWPTTDIYSFTAHGQPWIAEEWLGEVITSAVSKIGGVRGLDLLLFALAAATIIALNVLAAMRSNAKAGFLAAALFAPLAWTSFTLRPQMLSYLFLILTLIAVQLFRAGKRWAIWALPPIFLLWVNTHGLWLIGLGVVLLYWVCGLVECRLGTVEAKRWSAGERKQISLAFLLSLVALTVTPYGTELAAVPFRFMFSLPLVKTGIQEWQPMSFNTLYGGVFLFLALGLLVLQTFFEATWRLEEVLLLLGAIAMTCVHARFVLLFVPFAAPLLATFLARWIEPYERSIDKFALNGFLMAGMVLAIVHYFPSRANLDRGIAQKFPVRAVQYLRQHPVPGPMFNAYFFGGYLVSELGPQQRVFIDGRAELYETSGVLDDYLRITFLKPGGLDVLRRYQIQSCLLGRDDALSTVLRASPDWKQVYGDHVSVLFVRTAALNSKAKS
jgi:hypothetical protein